MFMQLMFCWMGSRKYLSARTYCFGYCRAYCFGKQRCSCLLYCLISGYGFLNYLLVCFISLLLCFGYLLFCFGYLQLCFGYLLFSLCYSLLISLGCLLLKGAFACGDCSWCYSQVCLCADQTLPCFCVNLQRMNLTSWSNIFIFSTCELPKRESEFVLELRGILGFSVSSYASKSPSSFSSVLSGAPGSSNYSSWLSVSWGGWSCLFSFLNMLLLRVSTQSYHHSAISCRTRCTPLSYFDSRTVRGETKSFRLPYTLMPMSCNFGLQYTPTSYRQLTTELSTAGRSEANSRLESLELVYGCSANARRLKWTTSQQNMYCLAASPPYRGLLLTILLMPMILGWLSRAILSSFRRLRETCATVLSAAGVLEVELGKGQVWW